MKKNFSELQKQMDPERLARAKVRAKDMMAEMLLSEIRRQTGLTQEELAASLGIKQPSLSKLESQADSARLSSSFAPDIKKIDRPYAGRDA